MIVINAAKLINGTGSSPLEKVRIFIEGEQISAIEPMTVSAIPEGAEVIDASDATLLPGLIDCHVHVCFDGRPEALTGEENIVTEMLPGTLAYNAYLNAGEDLKAGFTFIRDMHAFDFVDLSLRDCINQNKLIGPGISACGYGLTSTNGHMDYTKGLRPDVCFAGRFNNQVDSPAEARKAVRYLLKMGVDHIKINVGRGHYTPAEELLFAPEMQYDVIKTICEEAHYAGRKVAAHSLGGLGESWAVQAGVDSLEHAHFISREVLELMAEKGTFLVPTMTHCKRNSQAARQKTGTKTRGDRFMEYALESMNRMLSLALELGVRIGAGTDAGADLVPHGSNSSELNYLAEAGMSPMQAILAATKTASEIVGRQTEIGTLEVGKKADLLILAADPLQDLKVLENKKNILKVMKNGKFVVER